MYQISATNFDLLQNYIRQNGGIGGDYESFKAYAAPLAAGLWQYINDTNEDLAWRYDQLIDQALSVIEREFALVINQPVVLSWLRQLRQLPRVGQNQAHAILDNYRQQWYAIVTSSQQKAQELNRQAQCGCPQDAQRKYEQLAAEGEQQLLAVLDQMKNDLGNSSMDLFSQGLALANNIYQVEITALYYFVS